MKLCGYNCSRSAVVYLVETYGLVPICSKCLELYNQIYASPWESLPTVELDWDIVEDEVGVA